jgi:hypothetical protein
MRDVVLVSQKQQLDALFTRAEAVYGLLRGGGFKYEFEVQADLARYLCVRVSGFVDLAVTHLFQAYVTRHAPPKLVRFVTSSIVRHQNLKANRLLEITASVDLQWERELALFLTAERTDALNSLVENRNQIAHGRSTAITHIRVRRYYLPAIEIIEFLERKCVA